MRPRQMPRNFRHPRDRHAAEAAASMRPRQMPRNFRSAGVPNRSCRLIASMRPRQMPRNFGVGARRSASRCRGFNEAAADAAEF